MTAPSGTDHVQSPLAGIGWMLVTGLLFVGVTALVKVLGPAVPAAQAAFLRYALGLVFVLPLLRPLRRQHFTGRQFGLFALRGAAQALGVACWFFAMTRIPLAEVTAMGYLTPVCVTIGAALVLGERLASRRILAIVAALLGALIILRPGFREIGSGHMAMLGTALMFGTSYLVAKKLSAELPPTVVVAMMSITVTIGLAPLAALDWVAPTPYMLVLLFGVACLATAGHYTMTLAFRAAPISVTQPVTFLQLVWSILLGVAVFGEPVDFYVVAGGLVIIAAVSFITWREAVLKRNAVTPPVEATKL